MTSSKDDLMTSGERDVFDESQDVFGGQIGPNDDYVKQAFENFSRDWKTFIRIFSALPQKGMIRVAKEVAQFPLENESPSFRNQKEEQVFLFFVQLLTNKDMMLQHIMLDKTLEEELARSRKSREEKDAKAENGEERKESENVGE